MAFPRDIPLGEGRPGVNYIPPTVSQLLAPRYVARVMASFVSPPEVQDGHDIARYQPDLDYQGLADVDHREFVIVKATEGTTIVDPLYTTHINGLYHADRVISIYCFLRMNKSGLEQAEFALPQIDLLRALTDYRIVVWGDVETLDGTASASQRQGVMNAFGYRLHQEGDLDVGFYTSPGFHDSYLLVGGQPAAVLLEPWCLGWVAHWTSLPIYTLPKGWHTEMVVFWQKGISNQHSWVPITVSYPKPIDFDLFMQENVTVRDWFRVDPPVVRSSRLFAWMVGGRTVPHTVGDTPSFPLDWDKHKGNWVTDDNVHFLVPYDGEYQWTLDIPWDSNQKGFRHADLIVDGAVRRGMRLPPTPGWFSFHSYSPTPVPLYEGQVVRCEVRQSSGAPLDIKNNQRGPFFSLRKVGEIED